MGMSCDILLSNLGYECFPLSESVSRLISPFMMGIDGELAGVYVHDLGGGRYRVSDEADTLCHLRAHNVSLVPRRLETVEQIAQQHGLHLTENGELYSPATDQNIGWVVSNLINATLSVCAMERDWHSRSGILAFRDTVGAFLDQTYPHAVSRQVGVTGLSGHQLEIPFVVQGNSQPTYIHTVGRKGDHMNWHKVYEAYGIMKDIRELDGKRAVIINDQDGLDAEQAESILAESAGVYPFSKREVWRHDLVAA